RPRRRAVNRHRRTQHLEDCRWLGCTETALNTPRRLPGSSLRRACGCYAASDTCSARLVLPPSLLIHARNCVLHCPIIRPRFRPARPFAPSSHILHILVLRASPHDGICARFTPRCPCVSSIRATTKYTPSLSTPRSPPPFTPPRRFSRTSASDDRPTLVPRMPLRCARFSNTRGMLAPDAPSRPV
ncbi:hypothetical protein C8J57DRAFT_1577232, partial [Mycena rebaudengoi]